MLFKQFICRSSLETESSVRRVSTIYFISRESENKKREWKRERESGMSFISRKKACNKRNSIVTIKNDINWRTVNLLSRWMSENKRMWEYMYVRVSEKKEWISERKVNEGKQWVETKCTTARWSIVPVNKCYDHAIR